MPLEEHKYYFEEQKHYFEKNENNHLLFGFIFLIVHHAKYGYLIIAANIVFTTKYAFMYISTSDFCLKKNSIEHISLEISI